MTHAEVATEPVVDAAKALLGVYILGPVVVLLGAYALYATLQWVKATERRAEDQEKLTDKAVTMTLKMEDAMRKMTSVLENLGTAFKRLEESNGDLGETVEAHGKVVARLESTTDSIVRDAVRWRGSRYSPPAGTPIPGRDR